MSTEEMFLRARKTAPPAVEQKDKEYGIQVYCVRKIRTAAEFSAATQLNSHAKTRVRL